MPPEDTTIIKKEDVELDQLKKPKEPDKPVPIKIDGQEYDQAKIEQLIKTAEGVPGMAQEVAKLKGQLGELKVYATTVEALKKAGIDPEKILSGGKPDGDKRLISKMIIEKGGVDEEGQPIIDFNPDFESDLETTLRSINERLGRVEQTSTGSAFGSLKASNEANRLKFQVKNKLTDEKMAEIETYAVEQGILTKLGDGESAITVIDYDKLGKAQKDMSVNPLFEAIGKGDADAMVDALQNLPGAKESFKIGKDGITKNPPRLSGSSADAQRGALYDKFRAYGEYKVDLKDFTAEEVETMYKEKWFDESEVNLWKQTQPKKT